MGASLRRKKETVFCFFSGGGTCDSGEVVRMSVGFGGLDNSMEDGGVVDAREPDELEPEGNEAGNSG